MTLAAAHARAAGLCSALEDDAALVTEKRRAIEQLLTTSPRIAAAGATRFWVEPVPGRASLDAWCALTRRALFAYGPVSVGVGPTATVAWAAARHAPSAICLVDPADARAFLDAAPIEALEIEGESRDLLAALGVRTVAQLRRLSPGALGRRFGAAIALARRRAEGDDPRRPSTPTPALAREVHLSLDDELTTLEPLLFLLSPALERLGRDLSREGLGATELVITCATRGGGELDIRIRTGAPIWQPKTLRELARTHVERQSVGAPIVHVRVAVTATGPAAPNAPLLFGPRGRDSAAREVALGRLRARFGDASVKRAERHEVGPVLDRARYRLDAPPNEAAVDISTPCLPWRRLAEPAPVEKGFVYLGRRRRRVIRLGRVERATPPWWTTGTKRVELHAWAELEGPLLALLRARVNRECDDEWEVIAWVD